MHCHLALALRRRPRFQLLSPTIWLLYSQPGPRACCMVLYCTVGKADRPRPAPALHSNLQYTHFLPFTLVISRHPAPPVPVSSYHHPPPSTLLSAQSGPAWIVAPILYLDVDHSPAFVSRRSPSSLDYSRSQSMCQAKPSPSRHPSLPFTHSATNPPTPAPSIFPLSRR